ncbi:MAG TPA: 50S ribosomal protein L1 [Thermotogota bacterium]|mgnify:CR=1 FL=1|nr:50S ribosomal protein L1 [Thermotogota bacterium]HRW93582.1 50S ribosomal protein L1 [Thermotogota bacterium]
MPKHSKRFTTLKKSFDRQKEYGVPEAVSLLKELATAKFDETIELHLSTGIDPRKAEQQIRSTISLPHGTGKEVRILVFAKGDKATEASEAGADFVGAEDMAEKIQKEGWLDFDVAIATPDMMRVIGRLGKVLGPRGLMPSPKSGTVTEDIADAVKGFKLGRMEARNDKTGNIHLAVGKKSFKNKMLEENILSAIQQVLALKPSGLKGRLFRRVAVAPTMGPGVRLSFNEMEQSR